MGWVGGEDSTDDTPGEAFFPTGTTLRLAVRGHQSCSGWRRLQHIRQHTRLRRLVFLCPPFPRQMSDESGSRSPGWNPPFVARIRCPDANRQRPRNAPSSRKKAAAVPSSHPAASVPSGRRVGAILHDPPGPGGAGTSPRMSPDEALGQLSILPGTARAPRG